jgi:hypothetical protein
MSILHYFIILYILFVNGATAAAVWRGSTVVDNCIRSVVRSTARLFNIY